MSKIGESNFLFNFISPVYGLFYNSQKKKYRTSLEKVKKDFDISSFNSVIDVGCGTGALCSVLNETKISVTGVDPAKRMLNIGARKEENKDIEFVQAGTNSMLPYDDKKFDISIASYVAHGIKADKRKSLYLEMSRVSKRYVILYDYNSNRGFFTNIIEWAERGDYFNFIKNVKSELNENFKSVKIIDVDVRAALYICEPY